MKYAVVFVTVSSSKEGEKIVSILLSKKLAACVNQIKGIASTYWWKGKIEKSLENLLIIKTLSKKVPALIREVKKKSLLCCPRDHCVASYQRE